MKKIKISKQILAVASLLLLMMLMQSCTHYYYGPNTNNIPLLKKSGDIKFSTAIALASESSGFELQSAGAISNHIAVMANFYSASGREKDSPFLDDLFNSPNPVSYLENGSGSYMEGALGYFTTIGSPDIIFELYGGLGKGSITNNYSYYEISEVSAKKIFIQPSIGVIVDESNWEIALASRFSSVKLETTKNSVRSDKAAYASLIEINNHGNHFFWEPGFIIRGGLKNAKLQFQYTYSKESGEHMYRTQSNIFSLGLSFSISTKDRNSN